MKKDPQLKQEAPKQRRYQLKTVIFGLRKD
jgi:hypothetical protein